jgi:hypothetical protein
VAANDERAFDDIMHICNFSKKIIKKKHKKEGENTSYDII